MTDPQAELEAELLRMRPRAMSADLLKAVESRIDRSDARRLKQSWSDRILIFSMTSGAAAACVMVGMLLMQSARPAPATGSMSVLAQQPTPSDYSLAFARADFSRWLK
jgi:hypothetical protein